MSGWLKLKRIDTVVFVLASVIGFFAGRLLQDPTWSLYASILISYHIFLAWLVFSGEKKAGISLPLFSTILTHAACVFLVVALVIIRRHVPYFAILRFGISAIALFERSWLFTAVKPKANLEEARRAARKSAVNRQTILALARGEDHEAWQRHLAMRSPTQRRRGRSINEEYEQWLLDRARSRASQTTSAAQGSRPAGAR